jgi:hypothetical protein
VYPLLLRSVKKIYRIIRILSHFFRAKGKGSLGTFTAILMLWFHPKKIRIVEIGVFKGRTAQSFIRLAQSLDIQVFYKGFDLFDDIDTFYEAHPEDRALYDNSEYPYWEFRSGQHTLMSVTEKLSQLLPDSNFSLIKGDSTITLPLHQNEVSDADIVYIDGCHDYEVVIHDWENVSRIFLKNPHAVVIFDDLTYDGVAHVKSQIEMDISYEVFQINFNQFFVVLSHSAECRNHGVYKFLDWWFR